MKRFAVIGDPVAHSLSPILHQKVYQQLGLNASFKKIHVIPENLHVFMSSNEFDGFNVTIPHKQSVLAFLDELDNPAQIIGAVNCVSNGKGYNTDRIGFLRAMELNSVDLSGKHCTIIGAGGAARAIAYALIQSNVKSISIVNRTKKNAEHLAQWIKIFSNISVNTQTIEHLNTPKLEHVIINCTPLGMWPDIDSLPIVKESISNKAILIDTIYNPMETQWLSYGKKIGAKTIGGLDMFIAQGMASADIWFGENISDKVNIEKIRQSLIGNL